MSSQTSGKVKEVSFFFSCPFLFLDDPDDDYLFVLLLPTGHFERRVKFGHDADLIHVRAEFNGHMLRICIPRRIAPVFS